MGIVNFSIPKDSVTNILTHIRVPNFIETGTYKGDTTFWAAKHFDNVYTIEIDEQISKETASRSDCPDNIRFFVGNSKNVLPQIIPDINGRTFFWLDGHWCMGGGGKDNECPLIEELLAIKVLKDPIIFIDDARCFLGPLPDPHDSSHWPLIDEIFHLLKSCFPNHFTTIQDDVIMCVPMDVKKIINDNWQSTYKQRFSPPSIGTSANYKNLFYRGVGFIKRRIKKLLNKNNLHDIKENQKDEVNYRWISDLGISKVFDIGANEGQFALKIRKILPKAKIVSFEPLDTPFEELCRRFSNDSLFKAFKVALSTKTGKDVIYLNEYSPSSSLLKMSEVHKDNFSFARIETPISIETDILDNYEHEIEENDVVLMKIDVQGYEKFVLSGGRNVIAKVKLILIEVSYKPLYREQVLFDEIYRNLIDLGFKYHGNWEQLSSPISGEILQADAIFLK